MPCNDVEHLLQALPALFSSEYEESTGKYVLSTPFYLPDGDVLTFFFDCESGRLSDLGETVHRLALQGISVEGNKTWVRRSLLDPEVHFDSGELFIDTVNRPTALAGLINTAIRLADLELAKYQRRPKTFREDVKSYLSSLPIEFVSKYRAPLRDVQLTFDFYVSSPRPAYVETMHAQPKFVQQASLNVLGKWTIARKSEPSTRLITVVHPGLTLPSIVLEPLQELSLVVPWDYRDRLERLLVS